MNYWKLGCRWYSDAPLFFDYLLQKRIVVSWTDKKYDINDIILLTDGFTALGIAKVKSLPMSIADLPIYANDFEKLEIPHKDENLLVFNAEFFKFDESDQFIYQLQPGIRKIQKQEIIDVINKLIMRNETMAQIEDKIEILNYKKQIILQGPPGTGKTKLAKEIALKMIGTNGNVNLHNYLKKGLSIPNASGAQDYYLLEKVTNNSVELSSERATKKWSASFNKIQEKLLQLQRGETPKNTGGDDPYVLAVAKYIFTNISNAVNVLENNEQFKLIQFHPSYTYEDFVRGIVAESNGDRIEYKNINKTIGKFAKVALDNFLDSKKDIGELSLEKWIEDQFNQFTDKISETLEQTKIPLSDNVDLVDLMDDAFLYIGENWKGYEHRMSFKDIKKAYLDNNLTRQDIVKNQNLSGSARQHATYYIVVLKMFREFLSGKSVPANQTKINEKKYILVIDEINRANLSSVLGELIYALEYRGKGLDSMYEVDGEQKIILPENLYIIGTMNTADRSVGHIDYAIRRRFAFVEVLPEKLEDTEDIFFNTPDFVEVAKLFIKVGEDGVINFENAEDSDFLANDFSSKDVALGHSYFIADRKKISEEEKDNFFKMKMKYEVIPILNEYLRDGVFNESATAKIKDIEQRFA